MSNNKNNPFLKTNKRELAIKMNDVGADTEEQAESTSEAKPEAPQGELAELLKGITTKPKPPEKTQISVYLEPSVAKAFDKFGKKHGKGSKSELVNNFLKQVLNLE